MTPEDAIGWGAEEALADLDCDARIADTAQRNRTAIRDHDRDMDAWRHPIETVFAKPKAFRGMAMRFDKTLTSFAAFIDLVAGVIAAR